jgi:hypothetical protein
MELQHVESLDGSPTPSDIFEPHMPGVELLSDMDEFFDAARRLSATGEHPFSANELPPEAAAELEKSKGQRSVVIVTPGRLLMSVPAPAPGSVDPSAEEAVRALLPPDPPLHISVVSYTRIEALVEDKTKTKAIPFLGFLVGFVTIGHTVVVFEGHPSAFESGVRNSDVLLVDSGMLPFMQEDWAEVALRVMRPGARILVHERETYQLRQLVSPGGDDEPGHVAPASNAVECYADILLRLLLIGARTSVQLTSGETLPNLADFAATPEHLRQIASLPFKHDELNADKVIDHLLHAAGWRPYSFFKTTGTLKVQMTNADGRPAGVGACGVILTKRAGGRRQLLIER